MLPKPKDYAQILIIFFSATQLGLHFWPPQSLVYGVRIDYLAPTLYLFDLLLLSYLIARRSVLRRNSRAAVEKDSAAAERTDLIGTLAPILLTNLLFSSNPLSTLSWSLHFILYYLFLATLLPQFRSLRDSRRAIGTSVISVALPLSLLFQTILATTQVFLGHSVGGLMYYLGERSVAVGSPSIALATFMDQVVLRAYGTFSHPNILAGWSVICLLILIKLKSNIYLLTSTSVLTVLCVLLTQSRAALISLFGLIIPTYLIKNLKLRFLYYSITLLLCYSLAPSFFSPSRSDLSASQRLTLQGLSLSVVSTYPIFGTGAQASISTYPAIAPNFRLLQPDHNSFTLFFSWFGLFGVLAILYSFRSHLIPNSYFLIPLLPLLLLDHYLLTSPQGLFILLLYAFTIRLSENPTHRHPDSLNR